MKRTILPLLLCAAMLTGCSGTTTSQAELPSLDSMIGEEPTQAVPSFTGQIYYATDHGTPDPALMKRWQADLEAKGHTWQADVLADVPAATDTVLVLNAPAEDITQQDVDALDALFEAGGHMLLVMPANEAPVRYKFLERVLETYCIQMDYDLVTDSAEGHSVADSGAILMNMIGTPEGMPLSAQAAAPPLLMDDVRSFSFFVSDNYGSIHMDAMLETYDTAVGTPCGGTEEDPETFENKTLMTMVYAYDDLRQNSSVVAVGSGDFLLDAGYDEALSAKPRDWVTASITWMIWLNNRSG